MLRVRRLVPLALISALAATACGGTTTAPAAAHVLGSDVTNDQVARTANVITALSGLQHAPCGTADGATDTAQAACNRSSLSALIQFRLAEAYAGQHGIAVADADVQNAIDAFESQVGKDTVESQLTANGVSHEDLAELVRLSLLEDAVSKRLALATADEAKLRAQFEQNLSQYTTVTVDHILVKTKAEAEQVYRQVTAPGATRADFLALAKQVSIDPSAKQNSGAYPPTPASQYAAPFAEAAIALSPGEISKPVKTQFGWHVIHLVAKDVKPFDEVEGDLTSSQDRTAAFGAWVREQDQAGQIDVNPSFGRFDPTTLQVVRIASTDPSATASSTASSSPSPAAPPSG
jgi:parvulin-like peptidyl-prolyl isomerase